MTTTKRPLIATLIGLLIVLGLIGSACDPMNPTGEVLTPDDTTHIGATWFSPAPPEAEAEILARWDEASAAASVGRAMVDWIDVEPGRGDYRFDELDEHLADLRAVGQKPMASIVAVDTSGTEFPEWLGSFEADPQAAARAYVDMVEAALPILRHHDVWLLAIANEPPLADDDDLDRDDFALFVETVVDDLEALAPDLPVTFTFAGGDPFIVDPAIDRLVDAVDVYSVNHYCLDADLLIVPLDQVGAQIDAHVDRAGVKPIVFQEFGCPAGELHGSNEVFQLAWFESAFDRIAGIDQVRAAFVFEFLDWSEETFDLAYGDTMDLLATEVSPEFAARFREWLLTSGLVRIDGTPRPAFTPYLQVAAAAR